jgi:hypothetical protein
LLLTLADIALGYTATASSDLPLALTTINITADFAGHAKVGEWLNRSSAGKLLTGDGIGRSCDDENIIGTRRLPSRVESSHDRQRGG